MPNLWSQPLRDWRRLFAEQNPSLYHLLIQWPEEDSSFDWLGFHIPPFGMPPDELWRRPSWARDDPLPVLWRGNQFFRMPFQRGYREDEPYRKHVYYGHEKGAIGRFHEMAEGIVQCLTALPSSLSRQLPDVDHLPIWDSYGPGATHDQFWALLVHRLAWRKVPSSPLHARRKTWSDCIMEYDEGKLRRKFADTPDLIDGFGGKFPRHFCSILPSNIFQCSAWAIDLILAMGADAEETAGTLIADGYVRCTGPQLREAYILGNDPKNVMAERAMRNGDIKDFRMSGGHLYVLPANGEKRDRLLQVIEKTKENRRKKGKNRPSGG
jgi:hypothetical protein